MAVKMHQLQVGIGVFASLATRDNVVAVQDFLIEERLIAHWTNAALFFSDFLVTWQQFLGFCLVSLCPVFL